MAYIIPIRIPIDAYEKCGVDREKFLENIKNNAKKYLGENVEIEIIKGKVEKEGLQ